MSLDLTNIGGPIFLGRSRVNTDSRDYGTWSASSMQALLDRIVDGDPFSYWISATGDDSTTEVLEVSFQLEDALIERDIDFIALPNFNGAKFIIEYKAGAGAYATVPGCDFTVTPFSGDDFVINFATITADHLRLSITTTQVVDAQKIVGGFYACLSKLQLTQGNFDKYEKQFRQTVRELTLGDGSKSYEYIMRSGASYEHYGAQCNIKFASQAERDALREIKRDGDPIVFMPEPFSRKRDIFTGNFKGVWKDKYTSSYTGAGYEIPFNFEESGPL